MTGLAASLEEHRGVLFGVCYRMLGEPAEAHDAVQDTFVRALEKPPPDLERSLRPWLVTVASRLCIDRLRRRKKRAYVGPWLPGPCDVEDLLREETRAWEGGGADRRIELRQSATFAFLVALERCTPTQRAVLVLRDVFGCSTRETAAHLDLSEGNVKVTLHRARAALDEEGLAWSAQAVDATGVEDTLGALLGALVQGDQETLVRLLREDVVALSDGAGEVLAAKAPVVGREKVMVFFARLAQMHGAGYRVAMVPANASTAVVMEPHTVPAGWPPRSVLLLDLDGAGRVRRIFSQLAPAKVAAFGAAG